MPCPLQYYEVIGPEGATIRNLNFNEARSISCQYLTIEQLFHTKFKARLLDLRFMLQSTRKGSFNVEGYISK